jgi:peptidoglycan/LPS O-acetylase OafA/YrhL
MAFSIYLATPLVIGVTTYSLQTSLYYSYENIFVLLLGDLVLIMLVGLILTACLEMPFVEAHKELDYYIFGQSSKESVVIIED